MSRPETATPKRRQRETLIEVRDLVKHFPIAGGMVYRRRIGTARAVDGVSLSIKKGETLGLVGESGCGKSTVARCILQLLRPTSGEVIYSGQHLETLSDRDLLPLRRRIQIIFQDPSSSMNPSMTVGEVIGEPMRIHRVPPDAGDRRRRVTELMSICGLPSSLIDRYPHELSGGQRQRAGIARALSVNPEFVVCDEALSALDVSIQAQIINLLEDLREEFSLTYLFISHDLSVVRHLCDRVAVMYLGKIVEMASAETIFDDPLHPYTNALLKAVPYPDPVREKARDHTPLGGELPNPMHPPRGCVFSSRCPIAVEACQRTRPELAEHVPGRWVACSQLA